jgi:threonine dehydratase
MTALPSTLEGEPVPTVEAVADLSTELRPFIVETPALERPDFAGVEDTPINFKFELLQVSGTFKARGAFSNMLALDAAQRQAGVTCISAGNHAVAVAYAAMKLSIPAKVVMIKTASPARLKLCRDWGAQIALAEDGARGFDLVRGIEREEGRFFVHPFNGYRTILGTATLGAEWARQTPSLEAVILPIGGGGLAAGVSTALRLALPNCRIFGVEPEGADAMRRSFEAGHPIKMGPMGGIADSLMAPHTEAYSYGLCKHNIDDLVTVTDDALRSAMSRLFDELKLAPEPACAAATAALLGPLRARLRGKRVGVLLCGTNTDLPTLARHIEAAPHTHASG